MVLSKDKRSLHNRHLRVIQSLEYLFFLTDSYAVAVTMAEKAITTRKVLGGKTKKALAKENTIKRVKTEKNYF